MPFVKCSGQSDGSFCLHARSIPSIHLLASALGPRAHNCSSSLCAWKLNFKRIILFGEIPICFASDTVSFVCWSAGEWRHNILYKTMEKLVEFLGSLCSCRIAGAGVRQVPLAGQAPAPATLDDCCRSLGIDTHLQWNGYTAICAKYWTAASNHYQQPCTSRGCQAPIWTLISKILQYWIWI